MSPPPRRWYNCGREEGLNNGLVEETPTEENAATHVANVGVGIRGNNTLGLLFLNCFMLQWTEACNAPSIALHCCCCTRLHPLFIGSCGGEQRCFCNRITIVFHALQMHKWLCFTHSDEWIQILFGCIPAVWFALHAICKLCHETKKRNQSSILIHCFVAVNLRLIRPFISIF